MNRWQSKKSRERWDACRDEYRLLAMLVNTVEQFAPNDDPPGQNHPAEATDLNLTMTHHRCVQFAKASNLPTARYEAVLWLAADSDSPIPFREIARLLESVEPPSLVESVLIEGWIKLERRRPTPEEIGSHWYFNLSAEPLLKTVVSTTGAD